MLKEIEALKGRIIDIDVSSILTEQPFQVSNEGMAREEIGEIA